MIKKLNHFVRFNLNQRLNADRINKLQNYKLQKVIRHAYDSTQFYRKWMDDAKVMPDEIRCIDDLHRIPPISKSQIQQNDTSFISNLYHADNCLTRTTSGSSGKMLRVLWDQDSFWSRVALFYRTFSMIGYNPFKKVVYFLPVAEDTGFTFGLFRQMGLSLSRPMDEVRELLIKLKPHILSIYPSYAIDLGRHISDRDIDLMGIEAISLNSEMILDHDAALIEKKYKCPVYQEYSSVEIGMIASMCKEKGMHLFNDNVVVEILDSKGDPAAPGEVGEVIVTALNSFAMPFIRYRLGDYTRMLGKQCSCGSPFPLIGHIEGRKDDSFRLSDGHQIPAWKIYEIVERPLENYGMDKLVLCDFYLVQKEYDYAEFYYVKGPDFDQNYLTELQQKGHAIFGRGFTLRITELPTIDRIKTTKRKYIHCDLPNAS
ncbi:MAG: hypothetical protein SVZ03_02515 [Spirochaetota bacterium]|nr:hypothetical protein [Spirochaetota bacterium]